LTGLPLPTVTATTRVALLRFPGFTALKSFFFILMQRVALLTNAVMHITQLFNESKKIRISQGLSLVAAPLH
jgi:hypothetical protein